MSYLTLAEGAAPATPASGKASHFVDSTGRPKLIGDDGAVNELVGRGKQNLCRNGGMWFAQRQTPGTATTISTLTARLFGADGWGITNENASMTFRRVDTRSAPETGLAGPYWGEYLKITAAGKIHACQVIEATDCLVLRGRTVRVQCWMKQIVAASPVMRLGLYQLQAAGTVDTIPAAFIGAFGGTGVDPALGASLARIAPKAGITGDGCTLNGSAYDCTLTANWVRYGGVFDVPSDCKNLIVAVWSNAQLAATNGFGLSQVSLSDGYEIQDWVPDSYATELDRVRRYYQKSFLIDTAPVQNVGVNSGEQRAIAGKAGAVANAGIIPCQYEVPMRATPTTVTVYNPAAANALGRDITGAADLGATVITGSSANNFYTVSAGVAATAVGDAIGIHFSADAEL